MKRCTGNYFYSDAIETDEINIEEIETQLKRTPL